ncbi:MAG: hypothetical protein K5905_21620 [Roseibium sp.]|uniref:hypothetical protein n=1 Tax=Roseibium sp. TaxID=1936156 RepID=UPI0026151788|nr:hypothetical protein [Roseibium sp.]MCV0428063.1 hypothetical protein [Roseibium sp.]
MGETKSERNVDFAAQLPVPLQPVLESEQEAFSTRYRPNSAFLAHLIATRESEPDTRQYSQIAPLSGVNSYRATAALPRQRPAGHVLKTER